MVDALRLQCPYLDILSKEKVAQRFLWQTCNCHVPESEVEKILFEKIQS